MAHLHILDRPGCVQLSAWKLISRFPKLWSCSFSSQFSLLTRKHTIQHLSSFLLRSNKYQGKNFNAGTPPLPPRTQFLTAGKSHNGSYDNDSPENPPSSPKPHVLHSLSPHYHKKPHPICHLTMTQNLKGKKKWADICGIKWTCLDKPNKHATTDDSEIRRHKGQLKITPRLLFVAVAKPHKPNSRPRDDHIFWSKPGFLNRSSSLHHEIRLSDEGKWQFLYKSDQNTWFLARWCVFVNCSWTTDWRGGCTAAFTLFFLHFHKR